MSDQVIIYVYGSCLFSDRLESDEAVGNGGYGVVICQNGARVDEVSGGYSNTTNARMDIIGIMEGLQRIKEPSDITVYLTNGYVINTLSKGWLEKWKVNGYKKKKHVDLWKRLDSILLEGNHSISFKHSSELTTKAEYQHAEHLAKAMSAKKNMPSDLTSENGPQQGFFQSGVDNFENFTSEDDKPILDAICVDASCIENPGKMEYRGVDLKTGKVMFERSYEEATNNIGEFLAIVHALALFKKEGIPLQVVYSDSLNAISWVKNKKCKTRLEKNSKNAVVFEHIQRAIVWLNNNDYDTKVLKWNTAAWGEIPADYGRK